MKDKDWSLVLRVLKLGILEKDDGSECYPTLTKYGLSSRTYMWTSSCRKSSLEDSPLETICNALQVNNNLVLRFEEAMEINKRQCSIFKLPFVQDIKSARVSSPCNKNFVLLCNVVEGNTFSRACCYWCILHVLTPPLSWDKEEGIKK